MISSSNRIRALLAGTALVVGVLAWAPFPAGAVIIDIGDGTGNTAPPVDDPGFDNVGNRNYQGAVYLGDGWVIAPSHVFVGPTEFLGVEYEHIEGSITRLDNGDLTMADLIVWGILPHPPLPSLTIRSDTSLPTGEVIMIGLGRDRGAATTTNDSGAYVAPPAINPALDGFYWLSSKTFRWGTNKVTAAWPGFPFDTKAFYTTFDKNGGGRTTYEAHASEGDSGGAVFSKETGDWELAGLMFFVNELPGQMGMPGTGQQPNVAFHTNLTAIIDLSFYYDDIMDLTAIPVPEPAGGTMLATGLAFLLSVGRRRSR
jgi:hypothetical protein